MEHVKGLWLITSSGLCVLHRTYATNRSNVDQTLFAGFLTAIMAMAQEVTQSEIQRIDMKKEVLHFQYFPENEYYIVVSASASADERAVNALINELKSFCDANIYPVIKDMTVPMINNIDALFPEIDKITRKYFDIPDNTISTTTLTEEQSTHSVIIQSIKEILEKVDRKEIKPEDAAPQVIALYHELTEEEKQQFKKTIEQLEELIKKTQLIEKKQRKALLSVSGKMKTYMKVERWLISF